MKKRNIFLTVAGLAGMMLLGQGATAQQSADRQSNSDSSINKNDRSADSSANRGDASSAKSRDQSDSAGTAGDRAGQNQGRIGDRGQGLASRGQSSKENDQKFVECVAGMDQFEIQAAQLAEQQAQDDQIKEFAKQLLQDHEQTGKQLQQIAQQAGIPVSEQLRHRYPPRDRYRRWDDRLEDPRLVQQPAGRAAMTPGGGRAHGIDGTRAPARVPSFYRTRPCRG